ncbi:MAG: MCE family protein, partial [Armatimonadia bacterium]|nr:MCE family protein [Armatimonadia bacterium]
MSDRRQTMNVLTVGVVLVGALVLLVVSVVWLRTAGIAVATRDLDVYFWNIGGRLSEGNTVRLAGVRIGTVADIAMAPRPPTMTPEPGHADQETVVRVRCAIGRDVVIRESYEVQVNATNMVGDSYVEIRPVSDEGAPLADGQALVGQSPIDPFEILPTAEESLAEVATTAREVNRALVEEDLTMELVEAAEAIEVAMVETAKAARELSGMMNDNSAEITQTIQRVSSLTGDLTVVAGRMVELLDEDGLAGEVAVAVRDVGDAASSLGNAAKGLEKLLADSDNIAALQQTIDSIASTAHSVERMSGQVETFLLDEGGLDKAGATLDAAMNAAENLEALTERLTGLINGPLSEPAIISTMGGIQRATKDLSEAANRVSDLLDDEALDRADRVMDNMERASEGLADMADPDTVRNVRQAAESAREISDDLEEASGALRELMVESSFTEDLTGTVEAMREASEALRELSDEASQDRSHPLPTPSPGAGTGGSKGTPL